MGKTKADTSKMDICLFYFDVFIGFSYIVECVYGHSRCKRICTDFIRSGYRECGTPRQRLITCMMDSLKTSGTSVDITLQVLDNGVWKYVTSWSESSEKQYM